MEPIPKDVIDIAEDFFLHLSNEEFHDIANEFGVEQPFIAEFFIHEIKFMNSQEIYDQCLHMYYIINRSYKYYSIMLHPIDKDTVYETKQKFVDYSVKSQGSTTTDDKLILDMKALVNQDSLIDFLRLKIFGTDDNPVIYKVEKYWLRVYLAIFSIVLNMNNAMKKELEKELN
ncbi:MAG: hypothetical protein WCL14_06285 [Bacteroidota bacterium]